MPSSLQLQVGCSSTAPRMVFTGSRCRPWWVQGGSDPYRSATVHELNGNFHPFADLLFGNEEGRGSDEGHDYRHTNLNVRS